MKIIYLMLSLIFLIHVVSAGDEQEINKALLDNQHVILDANRVYTITGPIYIHSNNILEGKEGTVIRVSPRSSQWFQGSIGIISCSESIKNVEIYGFQINGNLGSLPASFANTPGHDKDCERAIQLHGDSNNFANNISVHDMKIFDFFSDGVHIWFADNVNCYNNIISNCQHEGIFWSCVTNSKMYKNNIAGITSDCARLDNCVNCKVYDNVFFSYNGDNLNGAYKNGENGLQVGNGGVSHGYDARNKPITTNNIEVTGNVFADNGLKAILLDSMALAAASNVFIHDNKFIGKAELETSGINVEIANGTMPTIKQSEQIFSSIFDILKVQFSTSAIIPQYDQIMSSSNWQKKGQNTEATLSIDGFRNVSEIDGVEYVPGRTQDNVIVNYQTRNNAAFRAGQTSSLSYEENNTSITAILTVSTSFYTKKSQNIKIFAKKLQIPSITSETETETFSVSALKPQTFPKTQDIEADIIYYNNSYNPHAVLSLSNAWGIVQETYQYNDSEASHFKLIGEVTKKSNGLSYVNYSKLSTWETTDNQISGYGNDLYISGHFQKEKLNVSVQTPYETVQIKDVNVNEVLDESSAVLNPQLWTFIGTLSLFGFFIYRNLKRLIR